MVLFNNSQRPSTVTSFMNDPFKNNKTENISKIVHFYST